MCTLWISFGLDSTAESEWCKLCEVRALRETCKHVKSHNSGEARFSLNRILERHQWSTDARESASCFRLEEKSSLCSGVNGTVKQKLMQQSATTEKCVTATRLSSLEINFQSSVGRKQQKNSRPLWGWGDLPSFAYSSPYTAFLRIIRSSQGRRSCDRNDDSAVWYCRIWATQCPAQSLMQIIWAEWQQEVAGKNEKMCLLKTGFNRCLQRGETWSFLGSNVHQRCSQSV